MLTIKLLKAFEAPIVPGWMKPRLVVASGSVMNLVTCLGFIASFVICSTRYSVSGLLTAMQFNSCLIRPASLVRSNSSQLVSLSLSNYTYLVSPFGKMM